MAGNTIVTRSDTYTARNLDEAVDQAVTCLRQEGIAVPPALIAAARQAGAQRDALARTRSA